MVGMMYASFYPQVAEGAVGQVQNMPDKLRQALRMEDIATAAGYLGSSVYGLLLPLLAMAFGTAFGARAIAGDEESGYLDLLLAHPISRARLALQRFAAMVVGSGAIGALVWVGMLAIRAGAQLSTISVGEFTAQSVNLTLLAMVFGALALAVGAATGRRALALAVTAGLGVASYAIHSLAGVIGAEALKYLSPFHYYIGGEPLRNGMQWGDSAALLAMVVALLAIGLARLERRDLRS